MVIRVYNFRIHIIDGQIIREANPHYLGYLEVTVFDLDMVIELCKKVFHLTADGWGVVPEGTEEKWYLRLVDDWFIGSKEEVINFAYENQTRACWTKEMIN